MAATEENAKRSDHKSTERARQKRRKKRRTWIVIISILVLAAGGFGYYQIFYLPGQTASTTEETQMQTALIRTGDLKVYASGAGELIPADEAYLSFPVNAEVTAVNVTAGDYVEEGDVLAVIDSEELNDAYAQALREFNELVSAVSIAEAKQAVATLETEISDTVSTLQWQISPSMYHYEVKLEEGQTALEEAQAAGDSDAIAEAEQAIKEAEAGIKTAAYYYENTYGPEQFSVDVCEGNGPNQSCYEEVYFPSESDINETRFSLEMSQAELQEAQDYVTLLETGEVPEGATGASINAYLETLEVLENAEEDLAKSELIAPFSGLVKEVIVEVGDDSSTETVITMIDNSTLYIDIYLDGSDWENLVVGYDAEITFDIYEDEFFTGKVIQVDPFLTESMGAYIIQGRVELDVVDADTLSALPIGSTADVDIIAGEAEDAILVPIEALNVIDEAAGSYSVFVVNGDELELRMVEVGLIDVYYAEVISGLEAGETVSTGIVETE